MNQQYRPTGFKLLPPVVKNLLIINGLVFLLQMVMDSSFGFRLEDYLGLRYPGSQAFKPWQFITFMFLHGDLGHIVFNMFALWMFGYALENIWGPKRFLTYYMITGVGAGLVHYIVIYFQISPTVTAINTLVDAGNTDALMGFINSHQFMINQYSGSIYQDFMQFERDFEILLQNPENRQALTAAMNFMVDYREYYMNLPNVIGASGAVFGILLAFGMLFPNTRIYIYFLFPIKAKYFVILYGAIELFYGISGSGTNIAHFAHLGGMVFGFFLIRYWKKKGNLY